MPANCSISTMSSTRSTLSRGAWITTPRGHASTASLMMALSPPESMTSDRRDRGPPPLWGRPSRPRPSGKSSAAVRSISLLTSKAPSGETVSENAFEDAAKSDPLPSRRVGGRSGVRRGSSRLLPRILNPGGRISKRHRKPAVQEPTETREAGRRRGEASDGVRHLLQGQELLAHRRQHGPGPGDAEANDDPRNREGTKRDT